MTRLVSLSVPALEPVASGRRVTAPAGATDSSAWEKKRAAHGVCPCCNRTFQNVARHMTSKHPEFVVEVGT